VTVSLGGHASLITHDSDSLSSHSTYTEKTKSQPTNSPKWNEEFRFDVADDTLLQDEPLIFTVCNSDSSSSSGSNTTTSSSSSSTSAIGLVYVDLNPLLMRTATEAEAEAEAEAAQRQPSDKQPLSNLLTSPNSNSNSNSHPPKPSPKPSPKLNFRPLSFPSSSETSPTKASNNDNDDVANSIPQQNKILAISGVFPIYDTLFGVRGSLSLSIKLKFIGDDNPFRDSSAGVQLFPFSTLDPMSGYKVSHVFGFVEVSERSDCERSEPVKQYTFCD